MTGEITLRGKVLPVGGIKEKILAGHRAGLGTILLPRRNEAGLDDVPWEIRSAVRLVFVESAEEALAMALDVGPAEGRRTVDYPVAAEDVRPSVH